MKANAVRAELGRSLDVFAAMVANDALMETAEQVAAQCLKALQAGKKILFAGNGGSAADAQHLAAEFVGRFAFDRPALPACALTVNTSILTAVGNDYGYDQIFARQLEALGQAEDVFFAISTSGRSPNIVAALKKARANDIITVGLTGAAGDAMSDQCEYLMQIPSTDTPRIQEGHIALGHAIVGLVEAALFQG